MKVRKSSISSTCSTSTSQLNSNTEGGASGSTEALSPVQCHSVEETSCHSLLWYAGISVLRPQPMGALLAKTAA